MLRRLLAYGSYTKNVRIQISWNYAGREESQKYLYEVIFLVHNRARSKTKNSTNCPIFTSCDLSNCILGNEISCFIGHNVLNLSILSLTISHFISKVLFIIINSILFFPWKYLLMVDDLCYSCFLYLVPHKIHICHSHNWKRLHLDSCYQWTLNSNFFYIFFIP